MEADVYANNAPERPDGSRERHAFRAFRLSRDERERAARLEALE